MVSGTPIASSCRSWEPEVEVHLPNAHLFWSISTVRIMLCSPKIAKAASVGRIRLDLAMSSFSKRRMIESYSGFPKLGPRGDGLIEEYLSESM
jgi:hypothetical protein